LAKNFVAVANYSFYSIRNRHKKRQFEKPFMMHFTFFGIAKINFDLFCLLFLRRKKK